VKVNNPQGKLSNILSGKGAVEQVILGRTIFAKEQK